MLTTKMMQERRLPTLEEILADAHEAYVAHRDAAEAENDYDENYVDDEDAPLIPAVEGAMMASLHLVASLERLGACTEITMCSGIYAYDQKDLWEHFWVKATTADGVMLFDPAASRFGADGPAMIPAAEAKRYEEWEAEKTKETYWQLLPSAYAQRRAPTVQ